MLKELGLKVVFGVLCGVMCVTGCVSHSSSTLYGGEFNRKDAAKTRMSLGLTYLKNNNYVQAKKNLDKALEFSPDSADVQYAMAYYYQLVGDIQRAEAYYEAAVDLAPNNADVANSYGAFKCQNGDYEQAKVYFFDAINNRSYANAAQTYENLALCAQSQANIDDAISYYHAALNHQPARAKTLFLLTELYSVSEQWATAKQTLQRYNAVADASADSLWLEYEIATGMGDIEEANAVGETLVELFPDNPLAKRYLAQRGDVQHKIIKTPKSAEEDIEQPASNAQIRKDGVNNRQNQELYAQSGKIHVVKRGENLYRISLLHNIKMAALRKWNNLDQSGAIIAGQSLWLVPPNEQEE